MMTRLTQLMTVLAIALLATPAFAQPGPGAGPEAGDRDARNQDRQRVPGGQGGPGGFGGPASENIELLEAHDLNGDGWLNAEERATARQAVQQLRAAVDRRGRGGRGGQRGRGRGDANRAPATPGPAIAVEDVPVHTDVALYDVGTLRTIFLTFENEDWEAELQDFHDTDVEVPATMVVDGRSYPGVGLRFRGASSYMRIQPGFKRSFNVSIDLVDGDQRLYGYKTLNLLNCNGDASMMSTVLYSQMADPHLAVPKANFVKVVINGEYWGVYANVQQFDKIFTAENFGASKGTRWKVPGSPRGDGGLAYDGDELEPYKARYDMKSNDGEEAWNALVNLCRVLNETPLDQLVEELRPILDIDSTLWFLAYDVALANSDGYWTRASDYSFFRDQNGMFHVVPHDMNEAFQAARGGGGGRGGPGAGNRRRGGGGFGGPGAAGGPDGPGGPGGPDQRAAGRGAGGGAPAGAGVTLDPLVSIDNDRMPLRSRLLAVPELRERYLGFVQKIAVEQLNPDWIGSKIDQYRELIGGAVEQDTRKLASYEAFLRATATGETGGAAATTGAIHDFARERRAFLIGRTAPDEL